MQHSRSCLTTLLLMLGFGYLGFVVAYGALDLLLANHNPDEQKWISLGTPPGGAVDLQEIPPYSNTESLIVKTRDGKLYRRQSQLFRGNDWVEMPGLQSEEELHSSECQVVPEQPILLPPVIDCDGISLWEWDVFRDYYAVLADGSVWRWYYDSIGFIDSVMISLITTILGVGIGFFVSRPNIRASLLKRIRAI